MNPKTKSIEALIAQDYVRVRLSSDSRCHRCGLPLLISENTEYAYQCLNCDEDFYRIEAIDAKGKKPIKEEYKNLLELAENYLHERIPVAAKYNATFEGLYRFLKDACDLYGAASGKKTDINTYCSGYYCVVSEFNIENFRTVSKKNSETILPTLEEIIQKCDRICSYTHKKHGKHQHFNGFIAAYNDILNILDRIKNQKEYDYNAVMERLFRETNEVKNVFDFCLKADCGKYAFSPYGVNKNMMLVIEKHFKSDSYQFNVFLYNKRGEEIETVYSIPFDTTIFTSILNQCWEREYEEDIQEDKTVNNTHKRECVQKAYNLLYNAFHSNISSNLNTAVEKAISFLGEYLND